MAFVRYRVKQTNLNLSLESPRWLQPNVDTIDIEAATATEALEQFLRQRGLQKLGAIDEARSGTANTMCRLRGEQQYAVIRAFPVPE